MDVYSDIWMGSEIDRMIGWMGEWMGEWLDVCTFGYMGGSRDSIMDVLDIWMDE